MRSRIPERLEPRFGGVGDSDARAPRSGVYLDTAPDTAGKRPGAAADSTEGPSLAPLLWIAVGLGALVVLLQHLVG